MVLRTSSSSLHDEHSGQLLVRNSTKTIEERSVERIPPPPTLIFDLDLPKFNHLIPGGQGYE